MSELSVFLEIFPEGVRKFINHDMDVLMEVIMDVGRSLVLRYPGQPEIINYKITAEDIQYVVEHVGDFGSDDRAGMDQQLHRISCIRNRRGEIIGLTCRVGRHVPHSADKILDLLDSKESVLILGKPGVGKSTVLRAVAHYLSTQKLLSVIVVDTSNELGGNGNTPHNSIGLSRIMQVPIVSQQARIMQTAVENHTPDVVVVDEIGNEEETLAARTIAERGVQLIGTAHGNTIEELLRNPTLNDLLGGIQSVILGDKTAAQRGTQKVVLERKAPPTFGILIEMVDRDTMVIHRNLEEAVDACLRKETLNREIRKVEQGKVTVCRESGRVEGARTRSATHPRVAVYGVKPDLVKQILARVGGGASMVRRIEEATHVVVRGKCQEDVQQYIDDGVKPIVVRTNNYGQLLTAISKGLQ